MSLALPNHLLSNSSQEVSDGILLDRFIEKKDDAAFCQLMQRHGSMLFAMARRLVSNTADAEDICQAAFLLLARKAAQLSRERSVAGWLVGVVRKLAADVRKTRERRQQHERAVAALQLPSTPSDSDSLLGSKEIGQQIDAALSSLPRKYRDPLMLCYWEGLSKPQATARLGWKPGTFSGRLARGKSLLQQKLLRKGIAPAVSLAWFSGAGQSKAMPPLLSTAVLHQAPLGLPAVKPLLSTSVYYLYQGALRSMFMTKLKWTAGLAAAILCVTFAGWGIAGHLQAQETKAIDQESAAPTKPAKTDQEKLQGKWYCVALTMGGSTPEGAQKNADALRDETWMEFIGDTIRISGSPAETNAVKYQLRTNVSPKQIIIDAGQMKLHGIYTLEDGLLVLRYGENASQANDLPKSFALGQKSSGILFVMQRERSVLQGKAAGSVPLGAKAELTPLRQTELNMKKIAIAVHNYASDYLALPANYYDKEGNAILSWRVRLLPYLEMANVYQRFKLDEPWNSPTNKSLMEQFMPNEYRSIGEPKTITTTPYLAFTGPGTLHQFNKKMHFNNITDGTSNTFLFVEAAKPVPWTCPDDLAFEPAKPFPAVGGRFGKDFLAAFCNGSVRGLPIPIDTESTLSRTYFKMVTPAGGEAIELPLKP